MYLTVSLVIKDPNTLFTLKIFFIKKNVQDEDVQDEM